ncbi:GntR family transcriptional regulator [Kitasatospora aburaviensis]|uniref:GntR family transcriptional regulator n=1 Tax=Kitasatospora aburaviensis TaxID=67265 RepID=A0ABW1F317_9ACTN
MRATDDPAPAGKQMLSERVYDRLRKDVLHGVFGPGDPLKPQELAKQQGVSLAVMREALVRLVGEGLATRLPNRGFAAPAPSDRRWQQLTEARLTLEPDMLRMAIERGDLEWETRVRAAHHRLARTPEFDTEQSEHYSDAWAEAHRGFHHALLEGCGNAILLEVFDRLWTASEVVRRLAGHHTSDRSAPDEHGDLEQAALARDPVAATDALVRHLSRTAAALPPAPGTSV